MIENIALEASAGSGKTFNLSARYISLVLMGNNPNKILALTFTNKAANEMKERVYESFKNLENKKNELILIEEITGITQSEIIKRRNNHRELFFSSNLQIGTIDSFFAQILRQFSLNLGLMTDFEIQTNIFENHLKEKLALNLRNHKLERDELIKLSLYEGKNLDDVLHFLKSLYEKSSEINLDDFESAIYPKNDEIFKQLSEIKNDILKANGNKTILKAFDTNSLEKLMSNAFMKKEKISNSIKKNMSFPELEEKYLNLKKTIKDFYIQRENYILSRLFALYKIYEKSRLDLAKEKNELDYLDVTKFVHILLDQKIDSDFLYFRLDSKIEHLLIDEFQDTSVIQYKILSKIIEEIVSGYGSNDNIGSFFYVGDTKQSIYRFRGGVKELFKDVAIKHNIEIQALEFNYRSCMNIVEFVNTAFKSTKGYICQKSYNNTKNGYVEVIEKEDVLSSVLEAFDFFYQNKIKENLTILCWTNKDATTIEEALSEKYNDIKISKEANFSLDEVKVTKALFEYYKYLYFNQEIYLANAKVLFGISWEEKLPNFEFDANKKPIEILRKMIKSLNLNQRDKNILILLEVALKFQDSESFLFNVKLEEVNAFLAGGKGIRVLTIHKSKGLQFEHVIVADRFTRENASSSMFLFDYTGSNLNKIYVKSKGREFVDEKYYFAKEKAEIKENEDKINAIYVALTRAKNSLIVAKKINSKYFNELISVYPIQYGTLIKKEERIEKKEEILELKLDKNIQQQIILDKNEEEKFDTYSIFFGTALHYFLEILSSFDINGFEHAKKIFINKYGLLLTKEQIISIEKRVMNFINDKKIKDIIVGGEVFKEQDLMYNKERKRLDLMIKFDNKIVIIDYKSSQRHHNKHSKQILLYKEALEIIYPNKKIDIHIAYLNENKSEVITL